MNNSTKIILSVLRIALGWLILYAGIAKLMNPAWSAAGYLNNAKSFSGLYHWFAQPGILPVVNFLNEWGAVLIGLSLISGILVRWASFAGVLMMLLYYIPILNFPYVGDHSYLVDEHVIYSLAFLVFASLPPNYLWRIIKLK